MEQFTKEELFIMMTALNARAKALEEKLQKYDYSSMPASFKKGDEDYARELRNVADKAVRMYYERKS